MLNFVIQHISIYWVYIFPKISGMESRSIENYITALARDYIYSATAYTTMI
jgi:hypothetical protein